MRGWAQGEEENGEAGSGEVQLGFSMWEGSSNGENRDVQAGKRGRGREERMLDWFHACFVLWSEQGGA